ncbi:MAG: hypothetical protein RKO24_03720 [Candidatus Competibacter sp.]|nr:hypothetical protein [Candidatus Competibacter sp.]
MGKQGWVIGLVLVLVLAGLAEVASGDRRLALVIGNLGVAETTG